MMVSKAQEDDQAKEPPNHSINRTRVPTSGYPFDHSGPVISALGPRSLSPLLLILHSIELTTISN